MRYTLLALEDLENGEIRARVRVEKDAAWFSGHFPEDPILPGIAQLHMVADCITTTSERNITMTGLSRIKFKKIVRPGEALAIRAVPGKKNDQYSFQITSDNQDVCSGMLYFSPKEHKLDKQ